MTGVADDSAYVSDRTFKRCTLMRRRGTTSIMTCCVKRCCCVLVATQVDQAKYIMYSTSCLLCNQFSVDYFVVKQFEFNTYIYIIFAYHIRDGDWLCQGFSSGFKGKGTNTYTLSFSSTHFQFHSPWHGLSSSMW